MLSATYLEGLSPKDLEDLIERAVVRGIDVALQTKHTAKQQDEPDYLTRKEAAKRLGISLVTLHRYSLDGLIPSYRIGTRIRYKRAEIEDALINVQEIKYKKR
jgi:excisionase family DNA binding protein